MIFNIQRYCMDDGDGIRTCVFFKGCPLRCPIVPGGNLDDAFLDKISGLKKKYPNMRVELMPYHKAGIHKAALLGLPEQEVFSVPQPELLREIQEKIGGAEIAH